MTRQELVDRMISMECGIDSTRLKRGDFSSEDEWKIKEAVDTVDDLPIYIDDAPGLTSTAILSRARRAVAKHGVELIVVDYLQLVKAENPRASRYESVTDTSIAIAQMAKSLKRASDRHGAAEPQTSRPCELRFFQVQAGADQAASSGRRRPPISMKESSRHAQSTICAAWLPSSMG